MPTPGEVLQDDNFWGLPLPERVKALKTLDPNFAQLRGFEQLKVVGERPEPGDQGFGSTLVKDIAHIPSAMVQTAMHPGEFLENATAARRAQQTKAGESFRKGDYVEAAGHGLAGMIPFAGPAAAQVGEEYGEGKPGQATAHALELAAPFMRKPIARVAKAAAEAVPISKAAGVLLHPKLSAARSVIKNAGQLKKMFGMGSEAEEVVKPPASPPSTWRTATGQSPTPPESPPPKPPGYSTTWRGTPDMPPPRGPIARAVPETPAEPSLEGKLEQSVKQESIKAKHRDVYTNKVVNLLKSKGVTQELAETATPELKAEIAKQAGVDHISDRGWKMILDKLAGRSRSSDPLPSTRFNK